MIVSSVAFPSRVILNQDVPSIRTKTVTLSPTTITLSSSHSCAGAGVAEGTGVGVGNSTGTEVGTGTGVGTGLAITAAVGNGAGATVGVATTGGIIAGMSVGSGGTVGKAAWAGVGVGSGSKTVKTNRLKLSTFAIAVDAKKSTSVANGVQAPPLWCWMTILSSFPAASAASAVLSVTVIVMGFNSGVSVVSSKALPVAVNPAGRAGISPADTATNSSWVGTFTVLLLSR